MLVAFEPGQLPPLSEIEDPAEERLYGVLEPRRDRKRRGVDAFSQQWDRREDFRAPKHAAGWGWDDEIGEDKAGIWCTRHPEALLADDPEVMAFLDEFFSTSARDTTRGDYKKRSAWWHAAWRTAQAAAYRAERRKVEKEAEKGRQKHPKPMTPPAAAPARRQTPAPRAKRRS